MVKGNGKTDSCDLVIKKLKRKYKMEFAEFEKKLGKEFDLTWEHEKDYIDWDWALTNIKTKQKC